LFDNVNIGICFLISKEMLKVFSLFSK